MAANALLQQIANPTVPDIYGGFRRGQEDARQQGARNALAKAAAGDRNAIAEVAQYDPAAAFDLQKHFAGLDETSRKNLERNTELAARELIGVSQIKDPNQRLSAWQQALQRHKSMGLDTTSYEALDPDAGMNIAASRILPVADLLKGSRPDPQLAETTRHNKAMEDASRARIDVARNRQANPPMPKPPSGYRYNPEGSLERTPGGPAEQKFRAEMAEDKANLDASISAIDATMSNINALIGAEADDPTTPRNERRPHPGLKDTTGAFDARTPTFFQDSKDAEVLQEALRSQASIQGLASVRGSSGSIGSMTQAEWPRLESLITALQQSQGTPQFTENARKYFRELAVVKRRLQNKFKETYEGGGKMPEMPQQAAPVMVDPIEVDW